ncbi:glutathione S-transferase [Sneathiella sp.]|uniref:glutathione S-transferase n=1 Tax=Sneathiella sp. TaxID=1964365 RepID=UPI003565F83E
MPSIAPQDQRASPLPILYSFRRCPYAIRSRMALVYSGTEVELRDILLKDKPADMVAASPKATVPVLKHRDGTVLEESLDIMLWALEQNDPDHWLPEETSVRREIFGLIAENDGPFKDNLDRYKYHVRFPEKSREQYRKAGERFLAKLEECLASRQYLVGDVPSLADMALFPFIRQFANADRNWFDRAPYPRLKSWLAAHLASANFAAVMKKRDIWQEGTPGILFPNLDGE